MGKFHNLLDAKFNPPRNWTLDTPLKFDSDTLSDEGRNLLKYCGVRVTNKNVVSVPKGYITDLASVPRFCWAFIAPFDVARAAVIHDILYEKINTAYKGEKILTKHDRERYRKVADDVFKEGMESAVPPVPKWKIWAAYNAVRVFGRWAINSSAPRRA
jgi:hypothetical protein